MISSLKSELRKIYSLRSTYVILLLALALLGIFAFYSEGLKAGVNGAALNDPAKLANLMIDSIGNFAFFGAIVAVLSVTHEYRYNTIMYTLTTSRSRTQSLLAKVLAISIFSVFLTVFVCGFATLFMYLGLMAKGYTLVHQVLPADLIWRLLFLGWGTCMFAALIAVFVRQQIGAMVLYFVLPGLGEQLVATLLLKSNQIYLPFTALQQVGHLMGESSVVTHTLAPVNAALVFLAYMSVGWVIAWVVFLRRDAS